MLHPGWVPPSWTAPQSPTEPRLAKDQDSKDASDSYGCLMTKDRILVIVDDAYDFPERDVPDWAVDEMMNAVEVSVIAPTLGSRVSVATADDAPVREAGRRLRSVMDYMSSIGVPATGHVSRDGPEQAIKTFLLDHEVDRILIGATLEGHWRERGLLPAVESTSGATVACVRIDNRHDPK